jgi:hypothetical protein
MGKALERFLTIDTIPEGMSANANEENHFRPLVPYHQLVTNFMASLTSL